MKTVKNDLQLQEEEENQEMSNMWDTYHTLRSYLHTLKAEVCKPLLTHTSQLCSARLAIKIPLDTHLTRLRTRLQSADCSNGNRQLEILLQSIMHSLRVQEQPDHQQTSSG